MSKLTSSVHDHKTLWVNKAFALCEHHFVGKVQPDYLRTRKENLQQDEAVILVDFVENYSFVIHDVVQGFDWEYRQVMLHALVVYHKSPNNKLESWSICVVSDHRSHNQFAVPAFFASALCFVKTKLPFVKKVVYFSDSV